MSTGHVGWNGVSLRPQMLKSMIEHNRRLPAAALFSLFMLSAIVTFQLSSSGPATAPAPARKPGPALTVSQQRFGNFMDFSKALPFVTKAGLNEGLTPYREKLVPGRDVGVYKKIFALQLEGKMKEADALIASLHDRRLLGHVYYQRYTHPAYKTTFAELKAWMDAYAAQPGAGRIYKLANARVPKGYKGRLAKPQDDDSRLAARDMVTSAKIYESLRLRSKSERARVQQVKASIKDLVASQRLAPALERLQSEAKSLDSVEYDTLQGQIAAAYMYMNKMPRAYEVALPAVHRSGVKAPMAGWVAGLTAWKSGRYSEAAKFFEITARSPYSSGWLAAGGAYWASRAHDKMGHSRQSRNWLDKASKHPRTFYGLIASRALGRNFDFNWHVPTFTKHYYDILVATPEGARAIALVAAGQPHRAEKELMQLSVTDADLRDSILSYAGYAQLPALAMSLGHVMSGPNGKIYDAALYPRNPWEPGEGYKIDPSLINAIARQESKFNPSAESSSGALGLMQLMPSTASFVSDDMKVAPREKEYLLKDPQKNLEVGQQYVQMLLKDRNVQGDIMKLLVAYNAGPGNLSRWQKQWSDIGDDPLLFIELLPAAETRNYVEHVLSNYWIYSLRENLPAPTLEALAAGKPAMYAYYDPKAPFRVALR
jgi:soluble lytic murein transglycosylase